MLKSQFIFKWQHFEKKGPKNGVSQLSKQGQFPAFLINFEKMQDFERL